MAARVAGPGLVCAVLLGLAAGCGNGGGGESRPTLSPSISPTRTLPAPTRTPTRTERPTEEPTETPTDQPTETPTTTPTDEPTPTPTPTPTEQPTPTERPTPTPTERPTQQPTQTPTETPTTTPTEPPTDEATEEATAEATETESAAAEDQPESAADADAGVPGWVWWVVAAVVVGAGVLTWLLVARSRRRRAWHEQLQRAQGEVAWLARELLPQLRSTGSSERVAGGWQVALPRIAAAEDQLTVLESSAQDPADAARAGGLRNALRDARTRVEGATSGAGRDTWAMELDEAIARLESALAPEPGGQR